MVTAAMKLKDACSLEENYEQPRQHTEKQRHYFADKGPESQGYGLSSSRVGESWTIKKAEDWRINAFKCGAGENSWESLRQQGNQTSQS